MNTEATAVVEKENEGQREKNCTECEVVELGIVSEDTQGVWMGPADDGGWGRTWL